MAIPPTLNTILANFETGDIPTQAQFAEAWTACYNESISSVKSYGATGDGLTNDRPAIQEALDNAGTYSTIYFPPGTYIIDDGVDTYEGQTLVFDGQLKLADGGTAKLFMVKINNPNTTLRNVRLDYDRDNNVNNGVNGTQTAITTYGTATNTQIIGGEIINCIDNCIAGGRDNLLIDGVRMDGVGEHAVYFNGIDANGEGLHANQITINNCNIHNVSLSAASGEGTGIQARYVNGLSVINCNYQLGAGSGVPMRYLNITDINGAYIAGGFGVDCNYAGLQMTQNCFDILIDGVNWEHSGVGVPSQNYVQTSSTCSNVSCVNSTFTRFTTSVGQPNLTENCAFYEIPGEFTIVTEGCKFQDCTFDAGATTLTQLLRLNVGADVIGCKFYGSDYGFGIIFWTGNTGTCTFDNNWFEGDGTQIQCDSGNDLTLTNNIAPNSISTATFYIRGAPTGVHTVGNNQAPSAASIDGFRISDSSTAYRNGRECLQAAAPTNSYWSQGSIVWNSGATASGTAGWVCVGSGTPGTWKAFGTIEA